MSAFELLSYVILFLLKWLCSITWNQVWWYSYHFSFFWKYFFQSGSFFLPTEFVSILFFSVQNGARILMRVALNLWFCSDHFHNINFLNPWTCHILSLRVFFISLFCIFFCCFETGSNVAQVCDELSEDKVSLKTCSSNFPVWSGWDDSPECFHHIILGSTGDGSWNLGTISQSSINCLHLRFMC